MPDDTTTPATEDTTTTAPEVPTNVVPFTPAASSGAAVNPQPASGATSTPAAEQPAAAPQINSIHDAVNHVVSQVDVNTISHHDIVHDLFQTSQEMAFKLLLAAKLFEHILIRDAQGLKGKVFDLLRHADEAVVNEVHAILAAKVTVPETPAPVASAAEVPSATPETPAAN